MRAFHLAALAVLAVLSALTAAAPLVAQESSRGCFAPATSPSCRSWWITEAGARYRVSDRYPDEQNIFFHYALGWMRNIGPRMALGGEVFGGSDGHARGGVAARARRWLSPKASVDLVVGVHLVGNASSQEIKTGSPTVQLRVSRSDLVAIVASIDRLALRCDFGCEFVRDPNTTRTRAFLGLEVGSGLGVVGFAGTALGFVIATLLYTGN